MSTVKVNLLLLVLCCSASALKSDPDLDLKTQDDDDDDTDYDDNVRRLNESKRLNTTGNLYMKCKDVLDCPITYLCKKKRCVPADDTKWSNDHWKVEGSGYASDDEDDEGPMTDSPILFVDNTNRTHKTELNPINHRHSTDRINRVPYQSQDPDGDAVFFKHSTFILLVISICLAATIIFMYLRYVAGNTRSRISTNKSGGQVIRSNQFRTASARDQKDIRIAIDPRPLMQEMTLLSRDNTADTNPDKKLNNLNDLNVV